GSDEEVLGAGVLSADHLLGDTADPTDLAVGGDGAGACNLGTAGDAVLAEAVHDPQGEHHTGAGAADLADGDVDVEREVHVVGDEDPDSGGAVLALLGLEFDLDL